MSGYLYDPALDVDADSGTAIVGAGATHAWLQAYLPGAGWLPFDPTNNFLGGSQLVPAHVADGEDTENAGLQRRRLEAIGLRARSGTRQDEAAPVDLHVAALEPRFRVCPNEQEHAAQRPLLFDAGLLLTPRHAVEATSRIAVQPGDLGVRPHSEVGLGAVIGSLDSAGRPSGADQAAQTLAPGCGRWRCAQRWLLHQAQH